MKWATLKEIENTRIKSRDSVRSVTDANGEIKVTITAIRKGKDWAAWAVPDKKGRLRFNKRTYNTGLAWGMFVEVK